MKERALMDGPRLDRTLRRIAREVVERGDVSRLVLVGVRTRGVPLARRLSGLVGEAARTESPPVGALDITLYRDDLTTIAAHPVVQGTDIPCSIDGRRVVLVDDVLYTGRTVRAALDELVDFGRPARVELAVLVDRGHRELPIAGDYVGLTVETAREQIVQVQLREEDGSDRVLLVDREAPRTPLPAAKAAPARRRKAARKR